MPRLTDLRKTMRRAALTTAAAMIENHDAGTEDCFGDEIIPEDEQNVYMEECKRVSTILCEMAKKVK